MVKQFATCSPKKQQACLGQVGVDYDRNMIASLIKSVVWHAKVNQESTIGTFSIIDQLGNLTKMCQASSSTLSKQHYRNCCKGFRELVCPSIVGQPICSWTYRPEGISCRGQSKFIVLWISCAILPLVEFFINICTQ